MKFNMKNARKNLNLVMVPMVLLMLGIFLNSCSKDDGGSQKYECATCVDTPDALAENDNIGKGVYKGIIVGSTGSLSIDIQNGSNTITATMVLDGITVNLISNVSYVAGQAYVAPFTGMYNGSPITLTFSVGLSGSNPTMISSDIPGHPNAVFTIYKESSTSLIEAFQGTYSKVGETGTFNILLSRGLHLWGGIAKKNQANAEADELDGIINDNDELMGNENTVKIGKISGDTLSGSFKDSENNTITITGQRTL